MGMQETDSPEGGEQTEPRAGLRFFALIAVAAAGLAVLWLLRRPHAPRAPQAMTVAELTEQLAGDEDAASSAQHELLGRKQGTDIAFWRQRLDAPQAGVRFMAIDAVGKLRGPAAASLLTQALEDSDSQVRVEAVHAMQDQDHQSGLKTVLAALRDDDTEVRQMAAQQLGYYRDKRAIPALLRALGDPDRATALSASIALTHTTGHRVRASYRDSPEQFDKAIATWEMWWSANQSGYPTDPSFANVPPIHPAKRFPAPQLHVDAIDGKTYSLDSLRGRTILLNFWGVTCGECIQEMPGLNRVAEAYAGKGVVVLGLEAGSADAKALEAFAAKHALSYPVASAPDSVVEGYGHIHEVPVTFLIDGQGQVRYQWDGAREYSVFATALDRVLSEKVPAP